MTATVIQHNQTAGVQDLALTEAIKDSPRFRNALSANILYFNKLESRIGEITKLLLAMNEFSKNYVNTFYKLTAAVNQLQEESFCGNALAQSTMQSLSEALGQTVDMSRGYFDNANLQLYNKLNQFVKLEIGKFHDARTHFEQVSNTMDEAIAKSAAAPRTKPNEIVETRNALTSVGTCFAHTTLDFVSQINVLLAKKDFLLIDALWSFVRESWSYFSRGHAFYDGWTKSENGAVADALSIFEGRGRSTERKMQDIHSIVPKEIFQHASGMPAGDDVIMEGYLFKRSSNAFKTWNRRWFFIRDSKLLYSHRANAHEEPRVMEENLMLCLVRPAPISVDRVGCFELVTPTRSHLLQADSESLCNDWMRALQRTIMALHEGHDAAPKPSTSNVLPPSHHTASSKTQPSKSQEPMATADMSIYELLRRTGGNDRCCDCGSDHPEPRWASINLGAVLCIECSGVHRSLGVQVSKVRSLTMDSIDAGLRDVLLALGNDRVNQAYLAYLPEDDVVPPMINASSSREARAAWIHAKYVERRFAVSPAEHARSTANHRRFSRKSSTSPSPSSNVHRSSSYANVTNAESESVSNLSPDTAHANGMISMRPSSCGSDTNLSLANDQEGDWQRLHQAAATGDVFALLGMLASNVDIHAQHEGTTAIHVATKHGQTAAVEFLLLNGAKINVLDAQLNTPLHLAAIEGFPLQACQLLKRGADKNLKNAEGLSALDIAMDRKHADIVTLFRVHVLRDEFCDEFNNPMDKTVDDVISDIQRAAANSLKPVPS